jgi:hypothetical protein
MFLRKLQHKCDWCKTILYFLQAGMFSSLKLFSFLLRYCELQYIDINNESFCRTRTFEVTSHLDFAEESWEGAVNVHISSFREAASHIVPWRYRNRKYSSTTRTGTRSNYVQFERLTRVDVIFCAPIKSRNYHLKRGTVFVEHGS